MTRLLILSAVLLGGCAQLLGISDPVSGDDVIDSGVDAARGDGGAIDAPRLIDAPSLIDAPAGSPVLTVKNYLSWCSVTVNGEAASTSATQTVQVGAGTVVPLSAAPASGFELGPAPWHDTDGDTGAGELGTVTGGTSSTTETVGATADCVWICCPFPNGSGCPTTDQCP